MFHWSLSDSKSPQVSRTLLSIPANAVVEMVSILPSISNCSNPIFKPLGTVPSASITIGITVNLMFHNFFTSLIKVKNLSLFSFSLTFTLWSARTAKSALRRVVFSFWFLLFADYPSVWFSGRDQRGRFVSQNLLNSLFINTPRMFYVYQFSAFLSGSSTKSSKSRLFLELILSPLIFL